jgi:hypothetical protein
MEKRIKVFEVEEFRPASISKALRIRTVTVSLIWTEGETRIVEVIPPTRARRIASKASGRWQRRPGFLKGLRISPDFDAPLTDSVTDTFGDG